MSIPETLSMEGLIPMSGVMEEMRICWRWLRVMPCLHMPNSIDLYTLKNLRSEK